MQQEQSLPWFLEDVNDGIELLLEPRRLVVLDFETTNQSFGSFTISDNDILLACWDIWEDGKLVERKHKFGNEYEYKELVDDINSADVLMAYNAKFELGWLKRCGLDLRTVLVYDPMVAEWVIHGNQLVPFNLEATAQRYKLGGKESLVSKYIKIGVPTEDIPRHWLREYCHKDVELCKQIADAQLAFLRNNCLEPVVFARSIVIPVLADVESNGLELDADRVNSEYEAQLEALTELGNKLDKITGGINPSSPKQLGTFLYDTLKFEVPLDPRSKKPMTTPSGGRPTALSIIDQLEATTEEQVAFLETYREFNKVNTLMTKNLGFFKKVVEERGGVFYGQINQCRTGTHRLAGGGVPLKFKDLKDYMKIQLQNIPRQYKNLFTAHQEGWVVTEVDGSQIEFRVGADLGHDEQAESDIVTGVDIHSFTRDVMNEGYKKYAIDKEIDRQGAKSKTFAPLFNSNGTDEAEEEYVKFFRNKYNNIYKTQQGWSLTVADRKKLVTPWGLTFYWPSAILYASGRVKHSTEIFNYPIQSLATGEIIPLALVMFWHRTKSYDCIIFNTVHDSIIFRSPEAQVAELTMIAKEAMTNDVYELLETVYGYSFQVPLGLGMKSGKFWGESSTEWKWDVWPDNAGERMQVEHKKDKRILYDTRNGDAIIPYTEVVL